MPYKEESYAEVLRWLEDTEIEYVPHGKKAGTKSYDRYEKYSQAKTVAEALNLGSKPLDLVNDLEKNLLKRKGGPIREKPLNILEVEDTTTLSETDLIIARWGYNIGRKDLEQQDGKKEGEDGAGDEPMADAFTQRKLAQKAAWRKANLSAKFGVKVENMVKGTGWAESPAMVAKRSRANVEASSILEAAASEGRKITDEEVLRVLRLWAVKQNRDRKNVMPEGMSWVHCETVGLLHCSGGRLIATLHTKQYPKVLTLFAQWMKDNRPEGHEKDFPFTSIIINSSYAAKRHRDHLNVGPTVVKAFGEFEGGLLRYWAHDDRTTSLDVLREEDAETLDIHTAPRLIDGNRAHAVETYKGEERFSLVFFTAQSYQRSTPEVQEQLKEIGIPFPTAEDLKYANGLLPKAKGYACYAEKKASDTDDAAGEAKKRVKALLKEAKGGKGAKKGALFARMLALRSKSQPAEPGKNGQGDEPKGLQKPRKAPLPSGGLFARVLAKRAMENPVKAPAAPADTAKQDAGEKGGRRPPSKRPLMAPGGLLARMQAKRALEQEGGAGTASPPAGRSQAAAVAPAQGASTPAKRKLQGSAGQGPSGPLSLSGEKPRPPRAPVKAADPEEGPQKKAKVSKPAPAKAPPAKAAPTAVPAPAAVASSTPAPSSSQCHQFLPLAEALSTAASEPSKASDVLANYLLAITKGGNPEAVLRAALCVLEPAAPVHQKVLAAAVSEAFGVPCGPGLSGEALAAKALEGRQKKRSLRRPPPLTIAEVAEVLLACAGADEASQSMVDRLAKLLNNSEVEGMEIFFLVRALQGKLGPNRQQVHASIARALVQGGRR